MGAIPWRAHLATRITFTPLSISQQHHSEGGNAFATARETHALGSGSLDIDTGQGAAQISGDGLDHARYVGGQFGFLGNQGEIGIVYGQAYIPQRGHNPTQQDTAVDTGISWVAVGEMAAYVTQTRGTQQSVAEGVDGDIAIGVGLQPPVVGHLNSGKHQGAPGGEAMGVDTLADQHSRP